MHQKPCSPETSSSSAFTCIDQMGRLVQLPPYPRRIVSLVPSQTELLFDLGLEEEVVGLTKFCVHPAGKKKEKTIIGGTKNFRFDTIHRLRPELIIGNKEENYQEGIKRLAERYPVWMSDIANLEDACGMINGIGNITGKGLDAAQILHSIAEGFRRLPKLPHLPAAYLIWKDPYMTVGSGTFIHDLLQRCGLRNVFGEETRYPTISPASLAQASPRLILLSSEPYPFKPRHMPEFKAICPGAVVKIVDGEMFSWYGSRLRLASAYFSGLLQQLQAELF